MLGGSKRGSLEKSSDFRRNLRSQGGPSQTMKNPALAASLPDFNSELLKEMNREKEKLNRFIDTKDANVQRMQEYTDKMRK